MHSTVSTWRKVASTVTARLRLTAALVQYIDLFKATYAWKRLGTLEAGDFVLDNAGSNAGSNAVTSSQGPLVIALLTPRRDSDEENVTTGERVGNGGSTSPVLTWFFLKNPREYINSFWVRIGKDIGTPFCRFYGTFGGVCFVWFAYFQCSTML